MPGEKKRKASTESTDDMAESTPKRHEQTSPSNDTSTSPQTSQPTDLAEAAKQRHLDRLARFQAAKAQVAAGREENRKAVAAEAKQAATDPGRLAALNRRQAIASHKLLKADADASGEDFERKRAWDWTAEESAAWDARLAKKEKHREDVAFADYGQEARKVYKRQLRAMGAADMEAYNRQKMEAMERAAKRGELEVVETEEGELVYVDKPGAFYSTANSLDFLEHRDDPALVEKLAKEVEKAEEKRLKNRRERMKKSGEEEDVTYINQKNKDFNNRLKRFYDKYTGEIRENFERGTAI